jgi:hypothetical protein
MVKLGGASAIAGDQLPTGLSSPPNALGSFISQDGVVDRSAGGLLLFSVDNLNALSLISSSLRRNSQFKRSAPTMSSIVKFVLITSMNSVEREMADFNINY